jgi:hypothetical protein
MRLEFASARDPAEAEDLRAAIEKLRAAIEDLGRKAERVRSLS